MQNKWRTDQHIPLVEGESIVLAIWWMVRKEANLNKRVMIFTDSETVLGALKKNEALVRR